MQRSSPDPRFIVLYSRESDSLVPAYLSRMHVSRDVLAVGIVDFAPPSTGLPFGLVLRHARLVGKVVQFELTSLTFSR